MKLERLVKVAPRDKNDKQFIACAIPKKISTNMLAMLNEDALRDNDKDSDESNNEADEETIKNILVAESTDILAKYRIPLESDVIDFNLELP